MVSDGFRWSQLVSDGLRWSQMVSDGLIWAHLVSDGLRWSVLVDFNYHRLIYNIQVVWIGWMNGWFPVGRGYRAAYGANNRSGGPLAPVGRMMPRKEMRRTRLVIVGQSQRPTQGSEQPSAQLIFMSGVNNHRRWLLT